MLSLGKVNRLINACFVKGMLRASGILGTVIIKACLFCYIAVEYTVNYCVIY
jgi:hypothetical protein